MREATREPHTWIMSLLYIGTFGSFIGFGFAFGQVLQMPVPRRVRDPGEGRVADLPRAAARLADPPGRRLRWPTGSAGAQSRFWNFLAMAAGAAVVLVASPAGRCRCSSSASSLLFVLSGIGNGSTYKMIPAIFRAKALPTVADGGDAEAADRTACGCPAR